MMKALTVLQPWASPIARGWKTIENRGWSPPGRLLGQWFAIHAGKNAQSGGEYEGDLRRVQTIMGSYSMPRGLSLTRKELADEAGCVVAAVKLVAAINRKHRDVLLAPDLAWWVPGQTAWLLRDVVRLKKPIPIRGQQGLWDLPGDIEAKVRAQLPHRGEVGAA